MTAEESAARDAVVAAAEQPHTIGMEGAVLTARVSASWLNGLLNALSKLRATRARWKVQPYELRFCVCDGDGYTICTCSDEARAERIARALNAAEQERA